MTTALISHPDCLLHVTPPGHPSGWTGSSR
jgi:hypothetical protein